MPSSSPAIDGILLFQMFALSSLYELFTQKHLSMHVQNSSIGKCWQLQWLIASTRVVTTITNALELFDFCSLLFNHFTIHYNRRIFKDKRCLSCSGGGGGLTKTIYYAIERDKSIGFSRKKFLKFLTKFPINHAYESTRMRVLRVELMRILESVEVTKENISTCSTNTTGVLLKFPNAHRDYYNILDQLTVQYEFTDIKNPEYKKNIFTVCSDEETAMHYEIS